MLCRGSIRLKVYDIDGLRIADGSITPRVPTGNTMAPMTVIGERAAEILRKAYKVKGEQARAVAGASVQAVSGTALLGISCMQ